MPQPIPRTGRWITWTGKVANLVRSRRLVGLLLVCLALVPACAPSVPPEPDHGPRPTRALAPEFDGPERLPPPDLVDDGPGSLIEVTELKDQHYFVIADATGYRVTYRSTSGLDGQPSVVSGVIAIPPGKAPEGGWPILAFGHDVTGVDNECAPSLADDQAGYGPVMSVMLSRGYVVVLPDYAGLGVDGAPHTLLDSATLGNNMIDAVRAGHRLVPDSSARWAAYGIGEGGAASWAANLRAGEYGAGLELVGAAALSPFADLTGLAIAASQLALTPEQYRLQIFVLESLEQTGRFDLNEYRSPKATASWNLLRDCIPENPDAAINALASLTPADLSPRDAAAAERMGAALQAAAIDQVITTPLAAPLLVVYATEDPLVRANWLDRVLRAACSEGAPIEVVREIGDPSVRTDPVLQSSLDWLQSRFDGQRQGPACQDLA